MRTRRKPSCHWILANVQRRLPGRPRASSAQPPSCRAWPIVRYNLCGRYVFDPEDAPQFSPSQASILIQDMQARATAPGRGSRRSFDCVYLRCDGRTPARDCSEVVPTAGRGGDSQKRPRGERVVENKRLFGWELTGEVRIN